MSMKIGDIAQPAADICLHEAPEMTSIEQPLGLRDPLLLNSLVDTGHDIEGFPLFAIKVGDELVFAIKDQSRENVLTVLIGRLITWSDDKETLQVQRTWTPEQLRRRGYAEALYYGLSRLRYRLVSDTLQTEPAFSLWKKLQNKLPSKVNVFDVRTGTPSTEDPKNNPSLVFVLETHFRYPRSNSILIDDIYFTDEDQ
jgi:hypothetical protein